MKTAVEWLMEQITWGEETGERYPTFIESFDLSAFFIEAKEKEKQQIINSWANGFSNGEVARYSGTHENAEQYYNETFKNE